MGTPSRLKIQCRRCNATVEGRDELEVERAWTLHECKGLRKLSEMDFDLLGAVAKREMSETDAWEIHDLRRIR